jgi:hypothetical protein
MKQDADVFCVKYGEKCVLCSPQVRFKVCGGFHMQTTEKKKKKKELHQQRLFSICPRKLG